MPAPASYLKVWIRHWLASFFVPLCRNFAGPLQFFLSKVEYTKINIPRYFPFFTRITATETVICGIFLLEFCEATRKMRALHAAKRPKRRECWGETHKVLWLLIGSLTCEKTSFATLIGRIIFFFTCVKHCLLF